MDVVVGRYEWDADKARENLKKHGVSFEEAKSAFDDRNALVAPDETHDERFILVGMSEHVRLLFVVHAEKTFGPRGGKRIRIISARRASKTQAVKYALGDDA